MSAAQPRVALVGLGIIGKRLADAVLNIPEISLAGVCVRRAIPALSPMMDAGIPIYRSEGPAQLREHACAGGLDDLLTRTDIVLDCTPRGTGAELLPRYQKAGVKALFQGGEPAGVAKTTYCFGLGFEQARTAMSVQVPSCNTTGLLRLVHCLESLAPLQSVRAALIRSAADPDKFSKGRPNSLVASPAESHHGKDIRALRPELDIRTLASYAPVNCGHMLNVFAKLHRPVALEEVVEAIENTPRMRIVDGEGSLADLRDVGAFNRRNDCHDVVIWRDGIAAIGDEILLSAGIHMEAIVIPETLDVLFAMTGLADSAGAAMRRSDAVLRQGMQQGGKVNVCSA